MPTTTDKAKEYRREAAACLEAAERMSLNSDRARLLQMAEHWLALATKAEACSNDASK